MQRKGTTRSPLLQKINLLPSKQPHIFKELGLDIGKVWIEVELAGI
jgi:hypothetical protein